MGPVGLSPADGYPAVIATRLLFTLGGIMARNTFLAHTLLRAVCPPPPWAEIIGLSWYDPDTGQASPPDFPEAPGGGHNIHLDILDVTLTHDNPHKRRLARAQLIDDQLHRRAEAATLKARLAAEHADLGYQARRRERREILRAALRTGHHRA
ncbi:hypothetical protein ABER32_12285 [Cutibacterium acnes]